MGVKITGKKYLTQAKKQLGLKRVLPSKRATVLRRAYDLALEQKDYNTVEEIWKQYKRETEKRVKFEGGKKSKAKSFQQRLEELNKDQDKLTRDAFRVRLHRLKKSRFI